MMKCYMSFYIAQEVTGYRRDQIDGLFTFVFRSPGASVRFRNPSACFRRGQSEYL